MAAGARWKWLLLASCTLVFVALGAAVFDNFGFGGEPWFGFWDSVPRATERPFIVEIVNTTPGGAAVRASLRTGDRIDLRDVNRDARAAIFFQPVTTSPVRLVVRRDGRTFATVLHPSSIYRGDVAYKLPNTVLWIVAYYLALGCAFAIAALRWRTREGRYLCLTLLAIAGASIGPSGMAVPSGVLAALKYLAWGVLVCAQVLLPVALAAAFGTRSALRLAVEVAAVAASALVLGGYVAGTIGLLNLSIDPTPFYLGAFWEVLGVAIFAIPVIAAALATAGTAHAARARTAWLLLPLPIALFAYALANGLQPIAPTWAVYMALSAVANTFILCGTIAVTFALLRRRVLDFEFIVSRTLVVASVSLIVVVAFVLLEWLLGSVIAGVSHTTSLIASGALALVLGLSLNYIHKRVDTLIDSAFFRRRRADERALRDFSKEAAYVTDSAVLFDRAIEKVERHTDARNAALLLDGDGTYTTARSFGDGAPVSIGENDGVVLALKTWHLPLDPHQCDTALRGALALPMLARGRLLGRLLLGERTGGEAYAPDEVEALALFAHGVGSAIDALSLDRTNSIAGLRESLTAMTDGIESLKQSMRMLPGSIAAELRDTR